MTDYTATAGENSGNVQVDKKGAIQAALDEQASYLTDLDQCIERLSRKLTPIITPKPEKPEQDSMKTTDPSNEYILTSIMNKNDHIKRMIARVSNLRNNLDC